MAAVDVSIRHDNHFAVPELGKIKFLADTGAERRDNRGELVIAVNAVNPRLLDVEHLAPKRQDGLIAGRVPVLLNRLPSRPSTM